MNGKTFKNEQGYTPTIGLEVHAELSTKTKMFCGCANAPHASVPNVNICPICMGHPGTLPTINKEAVKKVLMVGCALDGTLAAYTEFDRKNYFYPDIPKVSVLLTEIFASTRISPFSILASPAPSVRRRSCSSLAKQPAVSAS